MSATTARIAFVREQWRTAVASDDAIKTAYGEKARDSADDKSEPVVETYFDDPDDAQFMADERLSLLSPDRRRFRHDVGEVLTFQGDLDFSQETPPAKVIDDARAADHDAAIVEISVRFADKTTLVTWG
jgi:hypothetical protein